MTTNKFTDKLILAWYNCGKEYSYRLDLLESLTKECPEIFKEPCKFYLMPTFATMVADPDSNIKINPIEKWALIEGSVFEIIEKNANKYYSKISDSLGCYKTAIKNNKILQTFADKIYAPSNRIYILVGACGYQIMNFLNTIDNMKKYVIKI